MDLSYIKKSRPMSSAQEINNKTLSVSVISGDMCTMGVWESSFGSYRRTPTETEKRRGKQVPSGSIEGKVKKFGILLSRNRILDYWGM